MFLDAELWTWVGSEPGARIGDDVRAAGDTDGDGRPEVLAVGLERPDGGDAGARVLVFAAGEPSWTLEAGPGRHFRADSAGDVDGDGLDDLVVGVPDASALWIHLGPLVDEPDVVLLGEPGEELGTDVCGAGDVDADGYGDLLAAANVAGMDGRAYAWTGGPAGPEAPWTWATEEPEEDQVLGAEFVARAGDVDGDGRGSFVVVDLAGDRGRHSLYDGFDTEASWVWEGEGLATPAAGDVDGDGFGDLLLGAPDRGAAVLFFGAAEGLEPERTLAGEDGFGGALALGAEVAVVGIAGVDSVEAWPSVGDPMALSGDAGSGFGTAVALVGDVDGDGMDDIAVGAPLAEDTRGRVAVYRGVAPAPDGRCGCSGGAAVLWLGPIFAWRRR